MHNRQDELSIHRFNRAIETFNMAQLAFEHGYYRDVENRCYYAIFYAIKAILAIEKIDFKRHKDVIAYFNKNYVKNEIFPKELGKKISKAKIIREDSDYDDFYIATKSEAAEQIDTASKTICLVKDFLISKEIKVDEEC